MKTKAARGPNATRVGTEGQALGGRDSAKLWQDSKGLKNYYKDLGYYFGWDGEPEKFKQRNDKALCIFLKGSSWLLFRE